MNVGSRSANPPNTQTSLLESRIPSTRISLPHQFIDVEIIKATLDLYPDAALIVDLDGNIIGCNQLCLHLCKCQSIDEVLGQPITGFIDRSEYSRIVEALREKDLGLNSIETFLSDVNGNKFPVEISAKLVGNFRGENLGVIFTIKDSTEKKNLLERLIQEKKMFDTLMDSMPDAIYFKDASLRFIRINRSQALRINLKSPEEAIGKTDFDLYREDFARETYEDEQRIMRTGEPLIGKIEEVRNKDGKTHWVSTTKFPIKDESGKVIGLVGISRDITNIKLMEKKLEHACMELKERVEELQRIRRELERSNRELENYTYVVSHDLKAPLRAIRSFISFLLEDYSDKLEGNGLEYLKRIDAAAARMSEFIEDLLLLSRVGRKFMDVERVDLNELLDEIFQDLKPIIESKRAKVIVGKLPVLHIQRVWIKQLFMNLIDNGLKFNKSEVPTVEVSCEETPSEYIFRVKDNGIGIREEHLGRLFNLFERLHSGEEYEGTGAGLAICKKIVEGWGGRIWAESIFGKGSTFCFAIPKKYGSMGDAKSNG